MVVRFAEISDASAIADIYRPYVASTSISFEVDPPDAAEMGRRLEKTLPHHPWLVADVDGHIDGYAYATAHRTRLAYQWSVDVSAYVHQALHRRGIGQQLYAALIRVLTAQGYCNAYAGITLPNVPSVGLHEAVGFRPLTVYRNVGYKLGVWHDVGWWMLELNPHLSNPAPPRSLSEIDASAVLG